MINESRKFHPTYKWYDSFLVNFSVEKIVFAFQIAVLQGNTQQFKAVDARGIGWPFLMALSFYAFLKFYP